MIRVIEKKSRLLSKNSEELKRIEPNSMSLEFGTWISEIYLCCNQFYPSFKEAERAEIPFAKTEEQLWDAVKNLLPEIQVLEEYDLIEKNYKIISNASLYDTQELTTSNISEGFVIYEKLSI